MNLKALARDILEREQVARNISRDAGESAPFDPGRRENASQGMTASYERDDAQARSRWPSRLRAPLPLRRCAALVCRTCHIHSPSPHREDCAFPCFEPCCSRWFWLSPHGAIKCVACDSPADLILVEAWVMARETGEGDDGWRIPGEILSLFRIASLPQ
jgi:hypothetical protein